MVSINLIGSYRPLGRTPPVLASPSPPPNSRDNVYYQIILFLGDTCSLIYGSEIFDHLIITNWNNENVTMLTSAHKYVSLMCQILDANKFIRDKCISNISYLDSSKKV